VRNLHQPRIKLRSLSAIGVRDSQVMHRDTFTSIMSAFPAGVAVITTVDERGEPKGLTTTAVSSVSADPPLLLVCVGRQSRTLPALQHTRRFVVNFIESGYEDVCSRFASREEDKFAGVAWDSSHGGLPYLPEHTVAWAECAVEQEIEAGDHIVFIARVEAGDAHPSEKQPLVYLRRTYGVVAPLA
jgi:flavin reductase (DIM6/NTAB) family NADH-FMN oxidoreductase RutF